MQYRLPLVDGREIAFKSISAEDADKFYQAIVSQESPDIEEYIFHTITEGQYKDRMDEFDAGIILSIIHCSFSLSGVLSDIKQFPDLIEKAREETNNNAYNLLYTTIIKAMPAYKMEEIESRSLNDLLKMFAMAETILGSKTVDVNKLRELLGVTKQKGKASGKYKDREGKGVSLINTEELTSLTRQLNQLQEADFDELGRYIGDGNML